MHSPADEHHMRHTLRLAQRMVGQTASNPSVGCILVKNGHILAATHTATGGRPHAETQALAMAGTAARDATAYVTLEPCAHHGQTPPCADALIQAGIKRVVISVLDPDPRTSGQGIARLRAAGVDVQTDCLASLGTQIIQGFYSRITRRRPYVTAKIAMSVDGRIALANGKSQWLSNPISRQHAHLLRYRNNAIMVGSNTVRADNPKLTCRLPGFTGLQPLRVVLDTQATLNNTSHIFDAAAPTLHITQNTCPKAGTGLNLDYVMQQLAERGINNLLVEGGGKLLASLLQQEMIDSLHCYITPKILGGDSVAAIAALHAQKLDAYGFFIADAQRYGDDMHLHYLPKSRTTPAYTTRI